METEVNSQESADVAELEAFGWQVEFTTLGIDTPIPYFAPRASGGRGSGKTTAGLLRAVNYMDTFPGSRGMIVVPINDKLVDTIWPILRTIFADMGLSYSGDWEYNQTQRQLWFSYNKSTAFLRSAEKPDRLPGPNLAWVMMDDYRSIAEDAFTLLLPALRQPGYPPQIWLTSTGAGKAHWSRKYWLPLEYARDYGTEPVILKKWQFKTYYPASKDNPHLGEEFWQAYENLYGQDTPFARQEFYGEEVELEGIIFPAWNRKKYMVPQSEWPTQNPKTVIAGVDFGFATPSAILVVGFDTEGRCYILDEFEQPGCMESDLIQVARHLMTKHRIQIFICDSEDPRWLASMARAHLPVRPADKYLQVNNPTLSITLCSEALSKQVNGKQAFFVAPHLIHFPREMETYAWATTRLGEVTEKPRKKRDHTVDCLRYAMVYWHYSVNQGKSRILPLTISRNRLLQMQGQGEIWQQERPRASHRLILPA